MNVSKTGCVSGCDGGFADDDVCSAVLTSTYGWQPIAALPPGGFVSLPLPKPAEALFQRAVELAVSLEPVGSAPARPAGAYVYRGLCGKLWPVPAPAPASTSKP